MNGVTWSVGLAALLAASAAALASRGAREMALRRMTRAVSGTGQEKGTGPNMVWRRSLLPGDRGPSLLSAVFFAGAGAVLGWLLAGPMGAVLGAAGGAGGPVARRRRGQRGRQEELDGQLAEVAEGVSLALRSGLSVPQALDFSRAESLPPIRHLLDRFADEQRLGVRFETALAHLGEALHTDDATLFVMVTGIHARSGGDLAGALDEVARTIRHRVAVRRELRAATAQGRISGAIMGALPIGFFLFLSITSHGRLSPVLRSPPGMAMVGAGLAMEGLAYLWIRRLLVIEP